MPAPEPREALVTAVATANIITTIKSATTTTPRTVRASGPSALVSSRRATTTAGDCAEITTPRSSEIAAACTPVACAINGKSDRAAITTPPSRNMVPMTASPEIHITGRSRPRIIRKDSSVPAVSAIRAVATPDTSLSWPSVDSETKFKILGPTMIPVAR